MRPDLELSYLNPKFMNMTRNEFEELSQKKISTWNALWNLLLKESSEMREKQQSLGPSQMELQEKIENKIAELVKEEEILVDLYVKAAEAAKKKEEEFKIKIAKLVEQIERDKNFLKMYREQNSSNQS